MTVSPPPPTMPLRVTRNDKIADGIHLFEFRDPGGNQLPQFTGGAHIAVRVPNGLLRKYSLCNDPAERDRYQIAVVTNGDVGGFQCIPSLFSDFDEWEKTQPADRDPMHPDTTGLEIVNVEMEAGDLLIFNSLLAHGVRPNHSEDRA